MRCLILTHLGDETALRVYAALAARHGAGQVKLVSSEELVFAPYWAHRLEDSRVTTDLRLSDGAVLDSVNIEVVFNRLLALTMPHFASASEADRDYATREMNALCLSWLASLPCPVVNAATSMGLSAQMRSHAEWLLLAGKAGLPVQGYHFTTDPRWFRKKTYWPYQWRSVSRDNAAFAFERVSAPPVSRQPTLYLEALLEPQESVLVAGPHVVGRLASLYGEPLKCLAKIAGCDLLQVMFAHPAASEADQVADGNWKVCGVTPFPQIQTADAISAIVQLLEAKLTESQ